MLPAFQARAALCSGPAPPTKCKWGIKEKANMAKKTCWKTNLSLAWSSTGGAGLCQLALVICCAGPSPLWLVNCASSILRWHWRLPTMMSPHGDLPTLHRCIISPVLVIKASKMIFKGWSVFVIFIFGLLGLTCLACHASLLRHDSVSGSEVLFQTTNIHTLDSEGRKDAEVMQIYYNMHKILRWT